MLTKREPDRNVYDSSGAEIKPVIRYLESDSQSNGKRDGFFLAIAIVSLIMLLGIAAVLFCL